MISFFMSPSPRKVQNGWARSQIANSSQKCLIFSFTTLIPLSICGDCKMPFRRKSFHSFRPHNDSLQNIKSNRNNVKSDKNNVPSHLNLVRFDRVLLHRTSHTHPTPYPVPRTPYLSLLLCMAQILFLSR